MKKAKPFDLKVYVGCSLTHAPAEFVEEVIAVKKELEKICTVLHFVGLSDDTPNQTYKWDIKNCVEKCDLLFAICDYPAIGLGYEMAKQIEHRKKPCLAVAHEKSVVSKLILDPQQPGYEFRRYKNLRKEAVGMVAEKLKQMVKVKRAAKKVLKSRV